MPFKIRLKKSRQYNVVSKNLFVISVELLDRSVIECTLSSDSTGQICLNNVCQRVGLQQPEFFGLRFIYKRHGLRWIELSRPMKKQLEKHACEFRLYLAVMFYIPDVSQLKDEITRYHYFLQLKKDIIEGHLPCSTAQAVMLTAYCLQAEFGNHEAERHTCEYLKDFVLFPKQVSADPHKLEELMIEVLNAHKSLNGLTPSLAEINYIQFAQQLEGYGCEFFPSKNEQGRELFLGISLIGILAKYRDSHKAPIYLWTEIANLTHHKKYLVIECENGKTPLTEFQLEDADVAKYFWKLCVQQNKFYVKTRHLFSSYNWGDIEENSWRSRSMPNLRNTVNHNPLFEMVNSRQHLSDQNEHTFSDIPNTMSSHPQISYENLTSSYSSVNVDPFNAYSTESLNHGSSAFQLDSQMPTSSSNMSLHQTIQPPFLPHFEQRKSLLPAYRSAPDYDTAIKQKYGRIAQSQIPLQIPSASHSYESSLDRMQHAHLPNLMSSCIVTQQPEMKSYAHYENYEDLANLDENEHPRSYPVLTRGDDAEGGIVYPLKMPTTSSSFSHCAMQNLRLPNSYADIPIHTYSTPELTTDAFEHDLQSAQIVQQLKLMSPHSYIQRSSSSTPDLASQSVVAHSQHPALVTSNSNSIIHNHVSSHFDSKTRMGVPVLNRVPVRNHFLNSHLEFRELEEATDTDTYIDPPKDFVENVETPDADCESNSRIGLTKSNSFPAQVCGIEKALSSLSVSDDKSSTTSSKEVSVENSVHNNCTNNNTNNNQVKDSRCQLYENKRLEGSVFLEFEQVPKKKQDAVYKTALLPENATRNRFKDVLPYEDNRVKLTPSKDNKSGYINASHVTIAVNDQQRFYIASQGPLQNTATSFWQMVWEQNAHIIVMLTEVKEHGRDKCFPYWPQQQNEKMEFGDYVITKKFSSSAASYITSALSIFNPVQKKQRNIWHIQYTDWPDHGCPEDVYGFISFMEEIDSVRRHAANEIPLGKSRNTPMIVHCSAGVGRSGVTILCDVMIYSLDHNEDLEVSNVLNSLREQRMMTVQTLAQYKFVYSVLIQYLKNSRLI